MNYLHFDYECDGHQFLCACGAGHCYKEIRGFKGLKLEEQMEIYPYAYREMVEVWLEDNPHLREIVKGK